MALVITFVPGYTFTDGEVITTAKLNLLGNPTINLLGSISTLAIADGSVTTPKLVDGVLSADAAGRAKMADGFLSADAAGRGKMANGFLTAVLAEETFREGVQQYFATSSGSGTAYLVSLAPAATAYTAGMRVVFKVDVVNTGAATLNVNGLGAKTIKAVATTDIAAGRLAAGQIVEVVYDGTNFQLVNERNGFDIGETGIAAGLLANSAHGLGRVPGAIRFALRCKVAELGYSIGDEVDAQVAMTSFGGGFVPAIISGSNSTNVWVVCTSATMSILHKGTFAQTNLTAASWRIVGYTRI